MMNKKVFIQNFKDFQEYLKALLLFFDEFCRINGIQYTVLAGTMLGTIRNKGIIPWDGDVDVALTRKELNKLKKAFENYNGRYYLNFPGHFYKKRSKNEQHTFYCRIIDKQCPCPYFLIDVYTIDYLGDDYETACRGVRELTEKANKLVFGPMFHIPSFEKGKGIKRNAVALFVHLLHPFLFPVSWLLTPKLLRDVKKCEEKYLCFSENSKYEIVEASFGRYPVSNNQLLSLGISDYDFENFKVMCINNFEVYLKEVYGDYKKMPPIEKRVPYPRILLNKKYAIKYDDELIYYLKKMNSYLVSKIED